MLWFFYLALWITPHKRLFRRPAAIFYAKFWFLFGTINVIATILIYNEDTMLDGACLEIVGTNLLFGIFEPLIAYYTLILDSRWWQGFDSIKVSQSDIRSPLAGIDLNLASAQNLARSMDNMGAVLTSGGSGIRLLNFAYCEIDLKQKIGEGSFSKVYRGKYRQQDCAIKVVFTVDLTREVINRAAAEAKILSALKHPNIVNIFGVSVNPPSICILLEICEFGSLANVVNGNGIDLFRRESTTINFEEPAFKLSKADRFFLAVGCARGLNALHSMSSTLCHRDIKSFNFLVDRFLVVKLADLELGDNDDKTKSKEKDTRLSTISNLSIADSENANNIQDRGSSQSNRDDIKFDKDVLANWIAPEVLSGETYTQASDIYSFTLVLWEIISGEQPFSSVRKQDTIRKQILKGARPPLPHVDSGPWQKYIALISRGWQHDHRFRPSAGEMLCELECYWKECCFNLIVDTDAIPDFSAISTTATPQKSRLISGNTIMSSIFGSGPQDKKFEASSLEQIAAPMVSDPSFETLDEDGGAWIIVSAEPPYRFLRSTPAWEKLTGLQYREIVGKPFKDLCIYQNSPSLENNSIDEFQNNLWKMTVDVSDSCHTVLGVHDTDKPNSETISLFSLHAFPIRKRTPNNTGLPIRRAIPATFIPRYSVGSLFGTSPSTSTLHDHMTGKFALDKVTIPAPSTPTDVERISEDISPASIPFSQAHPVTLIAILFCELKSKEHVPEKSFWREISRSSRSSSMIIRGFQQQHR